MKSWYYFLILLLGAVPLSSEIVQTYTTTEREEEIVLASGQRPCLPLSQALPELTEGISDALFDKEFLDKIAHVEAEKLTGEYTDHWENGQLKIKAYFKEGKVDGHVHGWFADGQEAFKGFFYENQKVGIHISFFPSETIYVLSNICIGRILSYNFEGQLHGRQSSNYRSTRRLKTFAEYKKGVLHGRKSSYTLDEKLIQREVYENGELVDRAKAKKK